MRCDLTSARRRRWRHVVETAHGLRDQAPQRLESAALCRSPSACGERDGGGHRTHATWVGQHREEPGACRANVPGASEAPLDLRADLFDEAVVLHAGRAGIDARHAAQTRVPVAHHLPIHADLAAGGEIHQQDPATGRIHLLTPEEIGRARGKAESAVDAVGDERGIRRVVIVESGRGSLRRARGPALAADRSSPRPRQMPPDLAARAQRPRGVQLPLHRSHEIQRHLILDVARAVAARRA